MNININ